MTVGIYQEELDIFVKDEKTCKVNITEEIQEVITESNFQVGIALIHTLHTTTGITNGRENIDKAEPIGFLVQEDEPLLMEDLKLALIFGAKKFLCFLPLLMKNKARILDMIPSNTTETLLEAATSFIKPLEGFKHDNFEIRTTNMGSNERKNAEAHLKAALLRECMLWTFSHGRLNLGQWQSILFWDFDPIGRKKRKISVILIGE